MNSREIHEQIDALVAEEHELRGRNGLDKREMERLHSLEIQLDQMWDLLRQRRGKLDAGRDPNEATMRDPTTVERYQQ